ncbi:MAG TPA: cytochrome c peroxidase [Paucimonas sp.]|nr:cytochrome c peroxidase [Paucimonas sp.]
MKKNTKFKLALAAFAAIAGTSSLSFSMGGDWFGWFDSWSDSERAVLESMHIGKLGPAPKDPSNRVEDMRAAVDLGKRIFSDRRFSANQAVSCASCHDPGREFQDGRPVAIGVGTGSRRAMPLAAAGFSPFLFWDGRKDSLWAQALGPLEDPVEHGGTRMKYARLLSEHYRDEYERLFGPMPDLAGLPQDAGPFGSPAERAAWAALSDKARADVTRVFANMGKALAAFEKTLYYGESRFDRYVHGVLSGDKAAKQALSREEKNGLRIFINKGQCVTCHNGPLLTDGHFHNTGVPPRVPGKPDPGRSAAIAKLQEDEFNCLGKFSDAQPDQCGELQFLATDDPRMAGAFKTPSLRNVAARPPYMHAGQIASLPDVVRHYVDAPKSALGQNERKPTPLSEEEMRDLVAFLGALSGPITEIRPEK